MAKTKLTLAKMVENKLSKMEVKDSFSTKEFINEHWIEGYNYFTRRSFDVFLCQSKKNFPERTYRSIKGNVTRIM